MVTARLHIHSHGPHIPICAGLYVLLQGSRWVACGPQSPALELCDPQAWLMLLLLQASAAGVPDHTTAAVQGTRLSSCPTARLEQTDRQPGDGSNSSQGGDAGNTGMVGLAVQFPTSGTKCCVVGGLARVSVVVLLAPFLLSCMSLLSM